MIQFKDGNVCFAQRGSNSVVIHLSGQVNRFFSDSSGRFEWTLEGKARNDDTRKRFGDLIFVQS